jgi:K+-sensing histidine kinase KdpD
MVFWDHLKYAADRPMPPRIHFEPSAAVRYIVAAAAVCLALGVRLAFDAMLSRHSPYLAFVLAIIVAARYGGRGPALAATALSAFAAWRSCGGSKPTSGPGESRWWC